MSKMAAIHTAISLQLAADGKPARTMDGRLDTGAATEIYDADTGRLFLARVAFRLRTDTPSLVFDWQSFKDNNYLSFRRWTLEEAIAQYTQPTAA